MSICLSNVSFCQLKPVEEEIHRIDLKLEKFRKQHQTGTLLAFVGVALTSIPILVGVSTVDSYLFLGAGAILSLSGVIVSIDSYKHLKLESKRKSKFTTPKGHEGKEIRYHVR